MEEATDLTRQDSWLMATGLRPLPDSLPFERAALIEAVSIAVHAVSPGPAAEPWTRVLYTAWPAGS